MSLFAKKQSFLGIDIGADGIKLVELHKTKGRPQLWTYGIAHQKMDIHIAKTEKTPEDLLAEKHISLDDQKKKNEKKMEVDDPRITEHAKVLKDLMKQAKVTTKLVTASLPVSHIFHTVVTLPTVDQKEVNHHIEAKVKKLISRPLDEVQLISQKIPESKEEEKKYLKYLVTAAPRDLVTFYTAIFQKAGLQLEELETEAFALERSLVGRDSAVSMVVDIGAERTNFFIIDKGIPVTQRSIQMAGNDIDGVLNRYLQLDPESAKQVKHDMTYMKNAQIPASIFSDVLDPIVKEIKYSFDLYLHQTGNENKRPEKIILTGGAAIFPAIADYIQKTTSTKVFVGDPWARTVYQQGLKSVLDQLGPRMAVAIGLAMRNIV